MLRAAGLQPLHAQEEFAPGFKPRQDFAVPCRLLLRETKVSAQAANPQAWELADLPLHRLVSLGRRDHA
jgi:hypothetical protein